MGKEAREKKKRSRGSMERDAHMQTHTHILEAKIQEREGD